MSDLKIYKEIGSVPKLLGSDSIYAIRTGPGFDLYMTDTTGSVAYKVNSKLTEEHLATNNLDYIAALEASLNSKN